jgi:hypothetical protein
LPAPAPFFNRSLQPIINSELIYWTELSDFSILSPRHTPDHGCFGPASQAASREVWGVSEAFNVINHTNFVGGISPAGTVQSYATMNTNLSSSAFGQVQAAFDPRILQFALKLYF